MKSDPVVINLVCAWAGLLLGMVSGAILGLGFAREAFLGGYGSWTRRLCRLGHIAFFGLAFVNFLFFATVRLGCYGGASARMAGWLFVAGAVSMPLTCFVSAFWRPARHAFAIPVLCLLGGVGLTLAGLEMP
jgi:hypothetical protein